MKTFGSFDEMIEKLIDVAEFFEEQDEPEKKAMIVAVVQKMYDEHLELGKHLKETDPYLTSQKWIGEWLENPTGLTTHTASKESLGLSIYTRDIW